MVIRYCRITAEDEREWTDVSFLILTICRKEDRVETEDAEQTVENAVKSN